MQAKLELSMLLSILLSSACIFMVQGAGFLGSDMERVLLLNVKRLGLANRLRTVADWHQIAALTNRTLLLSWVPTFDCNAKFDQLFENWPKTLGLLGKNLDFLSFPIIHLLLLSSRFMFEFLIWLTNATIFLFNLCYRKTTFVREPSGPV